MLENVYGTMKESQNSPSVLNKKYLVEVLQQ